jgi:hypothetical protein
MEKGDPREKIPVRFSPQLLIDLFPVSGLNHQNPHDIVLNFANNPIIPDSIPPQFPERAGQGFPTGTGILK